MSTATVLLHDRPIATLSFRHGNSELIFDTSYREMSPRPVLSQSFEDQGLSRIYRQANGPQRFFLNLLPPDHSELKELLRKQHHFSNDNQLLRILGGDLPGAVKVLMDGDPGAQPPGARGMDGPLRASLGGLQLKFPANSEGGLGSKMNIPARGLGGRWILKFPSIAHPDITRGEFLMLSWARACGLNVPDARLVLAGDVENLPVSVAEGTPLLAVRRFDREADGTAVHAEDFAQVFGIHPGDGESIYSNKSYAGLARFAGTLAEREDRVEFCRRIIFMLVSGNGDAHLKNWGLVYPDKVRARLSPAYDLIFTRSYGKDVRDALALNLGGKRRAGRTWAEATRPVVLDVLSGTGLASDELTHCLDEVAHAAGDALPGILALPESEGLSGDWTRRLQDHADARLTALIQG